MAKHRIDMPDTIDPAIHLLQTLQADGWGLETLDHTIDYQAPTKTHHRIPVAATVTVHLTPANHHA